MRSIRLNLVVYFLLLLGGALGAVFLFVYETSAQTLRDKVESTRKLLQAHRNTIQAQHDIKQAQHDAKKEEIKAALDRRLLIHAKTLARQTRFSITHFESLYPLGALGAAVEPCGYLTMPLWWAQGMHPPLAFRVWRAQPVEIHLDAAEEGDPPGDYFQIFNYAGKPLERSDSLEDTGLSFTLDSQSHKNAEAKEIFDDVELRPGQILRRVTLFSKVFRSSPPALPPLWRWTMPAPKPTKAPPLPPRGPGFRGPFPVIFIQYASDTGPQQAVSKELQTKLNKELQGLEKELENLGTELVVLESDSAQALLNLGLRFWIIGGAMFVAVLLGGLLLVSLGLSPLSRLSEALRRVSPQDFRLQVDQARLPRELKPIAARLGQMLEQLKRAFSREKQAAADISHELRTPLAALMTTLDVSLKKPRTAEEYRELLEDCRNTGQHMTQLVERLLALARLDAGVDTLRPRSVDVADLANQCAGLVRPLVEARGLNLRVHAEGPTTLSADPDKLREVLTNLLHNAIEYNRPNGTIDVAVARSNGHLCLEVRDTGIGIAPEVREHIFERFYRADPSRQADSVHAGLGLAIVKGYVDLMGGTIAVESGTQGSTFRVDFPVS